MGLYWGVRFASVSFVRNRLPGLLLFRVETDEPLVALTFDDGPDPDTTERFIEALGDARATFFVLGMNVRRWPHLARAMAEAGHELASHGDSHRTMTRVPPRGTLRELRQAQRTIVESTGATPRFYRPPYGRFNLASWFETTRLGMRRTLWTAGARDWEAEATPELIAERILAAAATPGRSCSCTIPTATPGLRTYAGGPAGDPGRLPGTGPTERDALGAGGRPGPSRRRSSSPPA